MLVLLGTQWNLRRETNESMAVHKTPKPQPVNDRQRVLKQPAQKPTPQPAKTGASLDWPQLG
jgi:hypothetical protein